MSNGSIKMNRKVGNWLWEAMELPNNFTNWCKKVLNKNKVRKMMFGNNLKLIIKMMWKYFQLLLLNQFFTVLKPTPILSKISFSSSIKSTFYKIAFKKNTKTLSFTISLSKKLKVYQNRPSPSTHFRINPTPIHNNNHHNLCMNGSMPPTTIKKLQYTKNLSTNASRLCKIQWPHFSQTT